MKLVANHANKQFLMNLVEELRQLPPGRPEHRRPLGVDPLTG